MRTVIINNNGYLLSPYFKDGTINIEVTEAQYEILRHCPLNKNWRYVNNEFIIEDLLDNIDLKERRERECFKIVDNRSPMWYNNLSEEHRKELNEWYQAWLNVTETKIIPQKPEWL